MTVVVAFPEVYYPVNEPPQVIVGLDDYN